MSTALDEKIAHVAASTLCRYCGKLVPPGVVLCECRVALGELPHTEWPRELKRLLCVRIVERRMWTGASEQSFWERMLVGVYGGTMQGAGATAKILPMNVSPVDAFPYAAGDASLWAQSGYPTRFTI